MAARSGLVPAARGQVRAPRGLARLQVRRTELRAARDDGRAGRGDRRRRLRLSDRTGLPPPLRASFLRAVGRFRAIAPGLPRLGARTLLPAALLILQVLLRCLTALPPRARRL